MTLIFTVKFISHMCGHFIIDAFTIRDLERFGITGNVEIGVLSSGILSIIFKKTLRADLCITDLKYSFLSNMTLSADLCIRNSKYSFLSSMNS